MTNASRQRYTNLYNPRRILLISQKKKIQIYRSLDYFALLYSGFIQLRLYYTTPDISVQAGQFQNIQQQQEIQPQQEKLPKLIEVDILLDKLHRKAFLWRPGSTIINKTQMSCSTAFRDRSSVHKFECPKPTFEQACKQLRQDATIRSTQDSC